MPRNKSHVAIFFGGDSTNRDLSRETGYWACQYVPRDKYDVTPIHITENGLWQVPLGSLPKQGSIARMMDMLFKTLHPVSPKEGLQRLLRKPISSIMSFLRGKGGDDGAMQSLGQSLNIPVTGSNAAACHQTFNKQLCAQSIDDIASTPHSFQLLKNEDVTEFIDDIRDQIIPPLFVKPISQEGSNGIERVESIDELEAAVNRLHKDHDLIVQENAHGTEVNITLIEDEKKKIQILPPTIIVPQQTTYYTYLAKRHPGRVVLHNQDSKNNKLLSEVEEIARDVYNRLNCRGYASMDLIADDNSVDLLEVNTVPTMSVATPFKGQLKDAGVHPSTFLNSLIRQSLEDGF